jgi:hypothetical protein
LNEGRARRLHERFIAVQNHHAIDKTFGGFENRYNVAAPNCIHGVRRADYVQHAPQLASNQEGTRNDIHSLMLLIVQPVGECKKNESHAQVIGRSCIAGNGSVVQYHLDSYC